eukprot:Pgem_evm1s8348
MRWVPPKKTKEHSALINGLQCKCSYAMPVLNMESALTEEICSSIDSRFERTVKSSVYTYKESCSKTKLTKAKVKFEWGAEQQTAWHRVIGELQIKRKLTTLIITVS